MGDFFLGWRRKVGCVLLAAVTALTNCWVRSLTMSEMVWCDFCGRSVMFAHGYGRLQWLRSTPDPQVPFDYRWSGQAIVRRADADLPWWTWDANNLTVPYWLLVIPLVLISARLILTPRQRATNRNQLNEAT